MAFQVTCPNCNSKARIYSSRNTGAGIKGVFIKDLYCQCLGSCKARFVLQAGFSHYLGEAPAPLKEDSQNDPRTVYSL